VLETYSDYLEWLEQLEQTPVSKALGALAENEEDGYTNPHAAPESVSLHSGREMQETPDEAALYLDSPVRPSAGNPTREAAASERWAAPVEPATRPSLPPSDDGLDDDTGIGETVEEHRRSHRSVRLRSCCPQSELGSSTTPAAPTAGPRREASANERSAALGKPANEEQEEDAPPAGSDAELGSSIAPAALVFAFFSTEEQDQQNTRSISDPTPLPLQKTVNRGFVGASTRVASVAAQGDPPPPENEPLGAKGSGPSQQDTEGPIAFMFTNEDCGECSFPVVPTATAILVNGERAGSIGDALFGLYVTPGFGILPWFGADAQHGYIGLSDYNKLCERLAVQGLKPRALPTFQAAIGVGGAISILKSAEVPIGIQGVSGLVDLNVIDTELPFVLPKSFCKQLGLVLDTTDATATWEELGNRVSEVITLPGNHNAIDILEFPSDGWKDPHQTQCRAIHTHFCFTDAPAASANEREAAPQAFRIDTTEGTSATFGVGGVENSSFAEQVHQASVADASLGDLPVYRDVWRRGRGGHWVSSLERVP